MVASVTSPAADDDVKATARALSVDAAALYRVCRDDVTLDDVRGLKAAYDEAFNWTVPSMSGPAFTDDVLEPLPELLRHGVSLPQVRQLIDAGVPPFEAHVAGAFGLQIDNAVRLLSAGVRASAAGRLARAGLDAQELLDAGIPLDEMDAASLLVADFRLSVADLVAVRRYVPLPWSDSLAGVLRKSDSSWVKVATVVLSSLPVRGKGGLGRRRARQAALDSEGAYWGPTMLTLALSGMTLDDAVRAAQEIDRGHGPIEPPAVPVATEASVATEAVRGRVSIRPASQAGASTPGVSVPGVG